MNKTHLPFWGLTITYGAAFMLPVLMAEGMFLDGMIYAVLARNLAEGVGSFWAPHYSLVVHDQWFEHPPLGLNIQSMFYRVLGDGVWVEQVYSLATALICGVLIVVLWRQVAGADRRLRRLGWLPLLFWLMNPQVTWAYSHNMLENTMTIFNLGAVIFLLRACRDSRRWTLDLLLGAAAVVAAVLTKGFVGLFPLVTPFAYQLGVSKLGWRRSVWRTLVLVAVVAAIMALVLAIPAARYNITRYMETQFLASMSGERGDTGSHYVFLVKLLNTLLPAIAGALLIVLVGWRKRLLSRVATENLRWALTFLLLAMAGSVPLVVSPRQSMFYVLASFPFYAFAVAFPVAGIISDLVGQLRDRPRLLRFMLSTAGLMAAAVVLISATKIGTYSRSENMTCDVKSIGSYLHFEEGIPADREYIVGACRPLWRNWALETNLVRYHRLAMARNDSTMPFVVVIDGCANDLAPNYVPVLLETRLYHLYARRKGVQIPGDPMEDR